MYRVRKCRTCGKLYSPMKAKTSDRSRCYLCQRTPEQAECDKVNAAMAQRHQRSAQKWKQEHKGS